MSADTAKSRFERALIELQVGFKVMPVAVADAGAWHYAFVYEIVQRHLPELPSQARQIRRREAQRFLVRLYVDNTIVIDREMVRKVFYVLEWTRTELDRTLDNLVEAGSICRVRVKERERPHLGSVQALEGSY
jgi:hypothetical protein